MTRHDRWFIRILRLRHVGIQIADIEKDLEIMRKLSSTRLDQLNKDSPGQLLGINYQLTILFIYVLQSPQEASVDSVSVPLTLHLK